MSDGFTTHLRELAVRSNDGYLRGPALQAADCIEALEAERAALKKPENAAACILAGGMRVIAPVVLNAVQAEREKWQQNPDVMRGKVSPETITLSMFEACLRAITEITEGKADG